MFLAVFLFETKERGGLYNIYMKKFFYGAGIVLLSAFYVIFTRSANTSAVSAPDTAGNPSTDTNTANTPGTTSAGLDTTKPNPKPTPTPTPVAGGKYKDGSYTGSVADAYYGPLEVKAVISGGKIADVQFLQYPSDRQTSIGINTEAMPYLKTEAIAAQSANVNIVSGATQTSLAFRESLAAALAQAK